MHQKINDNRGSGRKVLLALLLMITIVGCDQSPPTQNGPIGPTPKVLKGWPKGKPSGKVAQKVVLDYCATLPKGEYSVKDITEGSGKSRGTVISALGLGANKQIVWYGKNNESVN